MPCGIQRQLAVVRLQCRKPRHIKEAEGEVVRAFKRKVREQKEIVIKTLSGVPAFGPLHRDALEAIADTTSERHVDAGEIVAAQDDPAKEFFIIVSGEVRVFRRAGNCDGQEGVDQEVNVLHGGSSFGGRALLTGEPYFTTYQAIGAVLLAVMDADSFHIFTDRAIAKKTSTKKRGSQGATTLKRGSKNGETRTGGAEARSVLIIPFNVRSIKTAGRRWDLGAGSTAGNRGGESLKDRSRERGTISRGQRATATCQCGKSSAYLRVPLYGAKASCV